jgi:hypothetical protein
MKTYLSILAFIPVVMAAGLTGAYLDSHSARYAETRARNIAVTSTPVWVIQRIGTNLNVSIPDNTEIGMAANGRLVWHRIGTPMEGWGQ